MPDYEILITGAGPAGCAAAYDLAHAGLRVLLLDKRSFPRHKACACGLTRKTLAALRYSVDPITERVCHEIVLQPTSQKNPGAPPLSAAERVAYEMWDSDALPAADKTREVRVKTRTPICAMAVRSRFDAFCLDQTLAAGRSGGAVTLRKIDTILALRDQSTHVELDIACRTDDGTQHTETLRASVLIGADGSNGQTRRLEQQLSPSAPNSEPKSEPDWYTRGFALEATVPFSSLPKKHSPSAQDLVFDFAPLPGGYGWLFPKGDHINIGVGTFAPSGPTATPGARTGVPGELSSLAGVARLDSETWASTDLKAVTRQLLLDYTHQKLGLTTPELDQLHITGQYLGMGGHAYVPAGRVLLTGDAAGLVDPLTGEGIHSAIVSGQAAAAAILETLKNSSREAHPAPRALAEAYARHLAPLQRTLAFSHRAAQAFYRQPERGFKAMRIPILRNLILKTYADGMPHTRLLSALAKLV